MRTGGSPAGIASVRARRTVAQASASARLAACFSPASSVIGKIRQQSVTDELQYLAAMGLDRGCG